MVDDTDFTPRLGKLRDARTGVSKRFRTRVRKAAKGLARKPTRSAFSGARIGRGNAASVQAIARARRLPPVRMRRVVVKVHIARARGVGGVAAFRRHLNYIQRDGVDREGRGGQLYGRDGAQIDGQEFAERSQDDRHQFRIIVSPEDAGEIGDLMTSTRRLMSEMERDLGTRLDWAAVDHHNTGHPHTHIVIRGRDVMGQDLVIARDYLMKGLRARAEEGLTVELGPRRDIEIARARFREVSLDRLTGLDRELSTLAVEGRIVLTAESGTRQRFSQSLLRQRLAHLEGLHLAAPTGQDVWQLKPNWERALNAMGRRGDIICALAAGVEPDKHLAKLRFFDERLGDAPALRGSVLQSGPEDELTDRRFLLVQDFAGTPWHVRVSGEHVPPEGAIVEVSRQGASPLRADRVVAEIAERSGGFYSDALHAEADPSASSAYRLAHKRRLEALRRAGIVTRSADGVWHIGDDYLQRAADFEAARGGGVNVRVRSWMAMEAQVKARAETWLDQVEYAAIGESETQLLEARRRRLAFLRQEGILRDGQDELNDEARRRLRQEELRRVAKGETGRSGRAHSVLETGKRFEGVFERTTNLGQGRMAFIGNEKAFVMVPWRADLERQRGQSLLIEARKRGIGWTMPGGRHRGQGR